MKTSEPSFGTLEFRREWVALSKIDPHPRLQHALRKKWGDTLAREFDPDAFGEPYLVENGAGGFHVIDGLHRCYAARKALGEHQQVYCRIYRQEDSARLADLALKIINRHAWTAVDEFYLRIKAEEWQARAIHGLLHQLGLKVAASGERGIIRAVAACDWIVEKAGLPVLERALKILFGAWGEDPDAYHNGLLRGAGLVCARYGNKVRDKELIEGLAKSSGPAQMVGQARDRAKNDRVSLPRAAAEIMRNEYNKGRRTHRLAALDES